MLYSYQGQYPEPLPFRIRLPNNFTRTTPSSFTQEEIESAGFTGPYEMPEYDNKIETVEWNNFQFTVRPYNTEELNAQWEIIREQRNQLLKDCDWIQISDYDLELFNKNEWAIYRQELRDLPQVQSNPFDISWPTLPSN